MSNLFKKVSSAAMALMIVLSIVSPASGVMAAYSTLESANKLASLGVIVDQSANPANYRLGDTITRGEMAKITMKLSEMEVSDMCEGKFSDLTSADWACKYAEAGLANGFFAANPTFRPMDSVTKIEALKMVMQARGIAKSSNSDWKAAYVEAAVEAGVLDSAFSDYDTVAVRGWIFQTAVNAIEGMTSTGDDLLGDLLGGLTGDDTTGTDTTGTDTTGTDTTGTTSNTSALTVDLSPSSVMAQSVPQAGTINFGTFDLTAGNEDVTVSSIKLIRQGLGSRSDFTRVWMEQNGVRVSGRQTVGSDDTVYITFSPALVITAGATESLDLIASLSAGSNSQNRFTIVSASDISATASIAGNFPISTDTMTTTSYNVVPVAYDGAGSPSTYRAGNTNVELGQFKLTNNATDDKSVTFKAISLRNDGTGDASANLANLGIYRNGVKVSSDVSFDGKNVIFAVNDIVDFGRTETYYIRGDVVSAELTSGDTYQFTLRYTDDLSIDETVTGFRSTVTIGSTAMSTYTVSGGDIILSKSTTAPSSQTVAKGSNDAVLLSADLKVSQPITLEDLKIGFSAASGTGNLSLVFSSIKLMIGGSVVATYTPGSTPITLNAKGSTAGGITLEGTTTVNADTTLKILANVKTNATPGTYTLTNVEPSDFVIREYASNGNAILTTQMVGSANGVSTTVGTASLTLTRNDGIANQDLAVGSTNQTFIQFAMRASDVSDVTVTKMTFNTGSASTVDPRNVTNLRLMVNGTTVSTKNMSTGLADFNDINVLVARNSDVTVKVVGDFTTATSSGETFQLHLASMEARDSNSVTLTSPTVNDGPLYTFAGAGSATFTLNSSTPTASMLTPSTSEMEVARFTLAAQNDSLKLTDLYVKNNGTADLSSSIKSIGLYDVNGTKLAGGSVLGTGTVQFALGSSSTFVVPKNTSNTVVVVKAAYNDVTDAAQTNKTVQIAVGYLAGVTPVAGTTAEGARLVSEATGNEVTSVTASAAVANTHLLVRSKPVVAISASATASTHTFTVTADANNRITLTGATFSITNPSATGGTFTIYKDSETSGNVIGTGTIAANGTITPSYFTPTEVSAGTTKTFIFKVSTELQSAAVNSKRIFRVENVSYMDMMNTGGDVEISSVSAYSNVGIPTTESTFTY